MSLCQGKTKGRGYVATGDVGTGEWHCVKGRRRGT